MPRQNKSLTPEALRKIAKLMRDAAQDLENLATNMTGQRVPSVSVAHYVPIENGILAARRLALDGLIKLQASRGLDLFEEEGRESQPEEKPTKRHKS